MGYPRAYRRGSHKYNGDGGFQRPSTGSPEGNRPPRPANDNKRPGQYTPPPDPANDNRSGGNKPVKLPELPEFPGLAADAAERFIRKLLPPPVRIGLEVAETAMMMFPNKMEYPLVNATGWTHVCGPSPVASNYKGKWAFYPSSRNFCGLAGQSLGEAYDHIDPTWEGLQTVKRRIDNGRWQIIESWKREGGAPAATAQWKQYQFWPTEVPAALPATVANPMPAYVPAPVGNELPGEKPLPATVPKGSPAYRPVYKVTPVNRPGSKPGIGTNPGTGPVVDIPPLPVVNPIRKPPGPGEKERKIRATGSFAAMNAALTAAAGVYEDAKFAKDIIKAFHDAMPAKYRSKDGTLQGMLAAVYRHYDKVDIEKAVIGTLIAVAGEKAGAYIDRARNTTARNLGLSLNITVPTGSAPRL